VNFETALAERSCLTPFRIAASHAEATAVVAVEKSATEKVRLCVASLLEWRVVSIVLATYATLLLFPSQKTVEVATDASPSTFEIRARTGSKLDHIPKSVLLNERAAIFVEGRCVQSHVVRTGILSFLC
jgi:hypothetical protein